MNMNMKFLTKATAAVIGSAVMLSAVPATAQIGSVDELLNDVRQNAAQTEQENREREGRFR